MKRFIKTSIACLAFTAATTAPVAAQNYRALPDFRAMEAAFKVENYSLKKHQKTCIWAFGSVAALATVGLAAAEVKRRKDKKNKNKTPGA